ncbi:hypothetical protein C8F04DRAFT_1259023 [Mycena alexandri]|uniref:Uncharacterized protein n=1 Tax=Mycena alexandri TaxID=1745969 RepID=A0AAD6SWR4_9AGAR|nr:hypothetical protein C8F04DRAFT_1259023 [Mycena alexandri]
MPVWPLRREEMLPLISCAEADEDDLPDLISAEELLAKAIAACTINFDAIDAPFIWSFEDSYNLTRPAAPKPAADLQKGEAYAHPDFMLAAFGAADPGGILISYDSVCTHACPCPCHLKVL